MFNKIINFRLNVIYWKQYLNKSLGQRNHVISVFIVDNEVPGDCVEHNYFDEDPVLFSNREYPECYSQGGRLLYGRQATHFGSCSEKVPCSYTPSETTKIYKSVCV